ncbi:pyridoxal 5'-phosphate synthase glutaminase subunit PdxT [Tepidibacillus fermentans]|uniref:Pyridoxal 5'-phosphate synthase subunit PdxT n=1 Tax=Tepidibacillus fermentans TaxID=1281767 RepID=A0A4R3K5M2_9BACI|nr:pyridoxal 5'-phosphate synthase glutaminase subunit PdxT [Tepidibacillus fermentans]TCS78134.1 5'-phosphate synthase pdxT subunit [Tepidibacillus fermentans]
MKIGVLALQGAVAEHMRMIEMIGEETVAVKKVEQLEELDGIIIPGGESTTIGKLMKKYGFDSALVEFSNQKKPIFGTCAGLIILAKEINGTSDTHLALMDIKVERNAFGRQRESFETNLAIKGVAEDFRAVFIRAPYIMEVKNDTEILSIFDDKIVAARQGHLLGSAFHPELTLDPRLHQYFVEMIKEYRR